MSAKAQVSTSTQEVSPLLAQEDSFDDALESRVASTQVNPLPRAQLALIYGIKLVVPISVTQVWPYVNKMVASTDVPSSSVGYYSGLLATGHTAGQFLTIFFWGRLSDRIGRTPVIAIGMTGLAVTSVLFGASSTFAMMLVTRFLNGVFCGLIGVIHSVVGELSDKTNQSMAFPYYDIISALGYIIGPIIGGAFAEPAIEYPRWFDSAFFRSYPYILPCIISAILAFFSAFLSLTYLRETNPYKLKSDSSTPEDVSPPSYGTIPTPVNPAEPVDADKPPSVKSLFALPVIQAICSSQWMLGFVATSFNTVFVLMSYTDIKDGGLSMNPRKIAGALSIMGLVSIGLKGALPIFLRRYDALNVFRFTLQTWPATFALMPLLNVLARYAAQHQGPRTEALLWAAISFVLFMSRIGALAFSIVMILTKDHTPPLYGLGTANSISELAQMLGISVGAPLISSLFAFSITSQIASGNLWVIVICALSLAGDYSASRIARYRFQ